jgi:integrase
MSPTFFATAAAYLECERPLDAPTDRLFVVLKGPRRGLALSSEGLDEIVSGARKRAGLVHGTCHELRHTCLTRLREAGMSLEALQAQAGHRSIASTQVYLHLGADWLAAEYSAAPRCSSPSSRSRPWHERRTSLQRGGPASIRTE